MKIFRNKYRTETLRLQGFDYSSEGIYFITICTKSRIPYFGSVINENMILSQVGHITANEWLLTKEKRPRIILGEWAVMPNHFHALIYLKSQQNSGRDALNAPLQQKIIKQHHVRQNRGIKNVQDIYRGKISPH